MTDFNWKAPGHPRMSSTALLRHFCDAVRQEMADELYLGTADNGDVALIALSPKGVEHLLAHLGEKWSDVHGEDGCPWYSHLLHTLANWQVKLSGADGSATG